jgi:hypothetical protein
MMCKSHGLEFHGIVALQVLLLLGQVLLPGPVQMTHVEV